MRRFRTAVAASLALALTAFGAAGCRAKSSSASGTPKSTTVVVHTAPGGGSDVFTRQVVKLLRQTKLISSNWPVDNQSAGASIGAMSFLNSKRGSGTTIAAITPTWMVTPMTLKNTSVRFDDFQPIAQLLVEPYMVIVPASTPYKTVNDFVSAAQAQPDHLVQAGGSLTAVDSLDGKALQAKTGAKWKYLTFSDVGSRITALLRGDAQMMIASPVDVASELQTGKFRAIGVAGTEAIPSYPNVPTLKAEGIDLGDSLPSEFRGFVGPPNMPASALKYYQDVFAKLVKTPEWTTFVNDNGDISQYADATAFKALLSDQEKSLSTLVGQLNLGSS
jgi:putative tricarboxylic transport membrane protein